MAEEKNFENRVKAFLKEQGCWHLKTWSGGFQRSGIPDLIICCKGNFIGVELKASNGKVSELQKYELEEIRNSGGAAMVLYPEGFEKFKSYIRSIHEQKRTTESEKPKGFVCEGCIRKRRTEFKTQERE